MKLLLICSILSSAVVLSSAVCIKHTVNEDGELVVWLCVRSKDVAADIARTPKDAKAVVFAFADIPVLKNDMLTSVAKDLVDLSMVYCNMEELEDDALKGMVSLKRLDLSHNKLKEVKSNWFKDTPNLQKVDFVDNQINKIEDDVAPLWKNVEKMHIAGNDLKCISVDFMNHMTKLSHVKMEMNPWYFRCLKDIMNWLHENEGMGIDARKLLESKLMTQTKVCVDEVMKDNKVDDVEVDKCVMNFVEKMMTEKVVDVAV